MAKKVSTKPKKKQEIVEDEDELLEEDEDLEEDLDDEEEDEIEEDDDEELEDDDDEDLDDEDEEEDDEDEDEDLDDEDEEDDEEEEDDEDEDDDDDEDLDDEDEEDDEEEEDEEPVKKAPAKKSKATPKKAPAKSSKKAPAKSSKKEKKTAKKGKTIKAAPTFEEYFEEVLAKAQAYKDAKESGASIPPSTAISNELLHKLVATYENEDGVNMLAAFVKKMAVKMGFDSEDVKSADIKISEPDGAMVVKHVFDVMYQVLNAEAGIKLFKTEDCTATMTGRWTEKKTLDTSRLNVAPDRNMTIVDPYLDVKITGGAPSCKKHVGCMKKGKFVESKGVAKKAKEEAPAKKSTKKAPAKKEVAKKASAKKTSKKK